MWRPVIEDSTTLSLFFDFYAATSPPLSNTALECLVSRLHLLHSLSCCFVLSSAYYVAS